MSGHVAEASLRQSDSTVFFAYSAFGLLDKFAFWLSRNIFKCYKTLNCFKKNICFHEVCFLGDFGIDFLVFIYTCSLKSIGTIEG